MIVDSEYIDRKMAEFKRKQQQETSVMVAQIIREVSDAVNPPLRRAESVGKK